MLNIYQGSTVLCIELQLSYMQWHTGWLDSFEVSGLEITVGRWSSTDKEPILSNRNFYPSDTMTDSEKEKG